MLNLLTDRASAAVGFLMNMYDDVYDTAAILSEGKKNHHIEKQGCFIFCRKINKCGKLEYTGIRESSQQKPTVKKWNME